VLISVDDSLMITLVIEHVLKMCLYLVVFSHEVDMLIVDNSSFFM
jgi:hypothetical protein